MSAGPTSLASYSQQINTTHPHTGGGFLSFSMSIQLDDSKNKLSSSSGYMIPHPPPTCFNHPHIKKSPRTRTDLLPSSTTTSSAAKKYDSTLYLSHSRRAPATSFVGPVTYKQTTNNKKPLSPYELFCEEKRKLIKDTKIFSEKVTPKCSNNFLSIYFFCQILSFYSKLCYKILLL